MRTVTLYTQNHAQALKTFFEQHSSDAMFVRRESTTHEGLYRVYCAYEHFAADEFTRVLEYVAVHQHPVYVHSPKLREIALRMEHPPIHAANVQSLSRYLREYRVLHMEGYATFRMFDFHYRLDMMMYSIIKKMRLGEQ